MSNWFFFLIKTVTGNHRNHKVQQAFTKQVNNNKPINNRKHQFRIT